MGSEASESAGGHERRCGRWGSEVEGCMPAPPHPIGGQVRSFLERRTVLRGRRRTIRGADVMRSNAETFWHQAKVRRLCPLSAALWPARVSHPKDGRWLCQPRGPDFARLPATIPLVPHVQSRSAFVARPGRWLSAACWFVREGESRAKGAKFRKVPC